MKGCIWFLFGLIMLSILVELLPVIIWITIIASCIIGGLGTLVIAKQLIKLLK